MLKSVFAVLAVVAMSSVAFAEGVPSQSKMSKLGLSSMQVASDAQGNQVRGAGFGATTITFTLNTTVGVGNTTTATGTQSSTFGQEAQALGAVAFGGSGFGGFTDSAAPSFATFVSTPITISNTGGGFTSAASIQGFSWGIGR